MNRFVILALLTAICCGCSRSSSSSSQTVPVPAPRPPATDTDSTDTDTTDTTDTDVASLPLEVRRFKAPQTVTDKEWESILTPNQYYVTRDHGTEHAFDNAWWDSKKKGTYTCVCCGEPLFSSETKYKSGTGWPSFWDPVNKKCIATKKDFSFFGSLRIEVHCRRCNAHLGHVFTDGPQPTGLRYCINSASLDLKEAKPDE